MKQLNVSLVVAVLVFIATVGAALAQGASPSGVWETIDDKDHKPTSKVKIWVNKGELYGKITALIDPDEPNPNCDKCKGKRHMQPVIGMLIIWNLEKEQDSEWWDGGYILDPDNGKTYRCKVRVTNGGAKLEVRGYLGISLLGRSQTWNRKK